MDAVVKPKRSPSKPLTQEEIIAIIGLAKKGFTNAEIAAKVGCTKAQVQRVIYDYKKICKEKGIPHGIPERKATKNGSVIKSTLSQIANGSVNLDDVLKKFGL